jgi:hypothetical protein
LSDRRTPIVFFCGFPNFGELPKKPVYFLCFIVSSCDTVCYSY